MPRKWTILIISVVVILMAFFARGVILSTFFEWYLKGYCRANLGSRLSYENLRHENGRWIFEHPVLTTKNRMEQGGYRCQAESATIELSIEWIKRSIFLNIEIDSPHVDIGTGAKDLKKIVDSPPHSSTFIDLHTVFTVPQGSIFIHDFTEDHIASVPLFFSVDFAHQEKSEGCISLWVGDRSKDSRNLFAVFSEKDSNTNQLAIDLHNIDIASIQQTIHGLWPETAPIEISKGSVDGNLTITIPKGSDTYAEGKVSMKDLSLHHLGVDSKLNIPDLTIDLFPKIETTNEITTTHTVGHLEIPSSANLIIFKEGESLWKINDIGGIVSFESHNAMKFIITGSVESKKNLRHLHIEGVEHPLGWGKKSFFIDMELKGAEEQDDVSFHFSTRHLDEQQSLGEVELSGFGSDELAFLQHLVRHRYPDWEALNILHGTLNASAIVYFKGKSLSEVNVENITAHDVAFEYAPWALSGNTESAFGSLSFNLFASDPLNTLQMDLNIHQATIDIENFDAKKWRFSNVKTNLAVRHGIIQKSLLQGSIAGLDGEVILDGTSAAPLATAQFIGPAKDFLQMFPELTTKQFAEDGLTITVNAEKCPNGLLFTGTLLVDDSHEKEDKIDFGFTLEKASEGLWRQWSPQCITDAYSAETNHSLLYSIVPALEASMHVIYKHLIRNEFGFGDIALRNGWFAASNLPIEKYVSSFLFPKDQIKASGIGDFHGNFSKKKLIINYDTKNLTFENDDFCIEIPTLRDCEKLNCTSGLNQNPGVDLSKTTQHDSMEHFPIDQPRELSLSPNVQVDFAQSLTPSRSWPATYVFDFEKNQGVNTLPIHDGTYFEKNTGLLFTEINADMQTINDTARFSGLTTFCNGLYFSGSIDLDWSAPEEGNFTVDVHTNEMHGKISQLQHLLKHIQKDMFFLKIPIEGNVSLQNKNSAISFAFSNEGYEIQSKIHGALSDGVIKETNADISIHELGILFDYDHDGNTFILSDIQGTVLVGTPNHMEEYGITADRIIFSDYANKEMQFDIWIGDKKRDIIRLAGKTRAISDIEGESLITFEFDRKLSHFGNVHPKVFDLTLKEWSQVKKLDVECEFTLNTFLEDLQRFSRSGLFFLSRGWLKEMNDITSAEGNFNATLSYDDARSVMNYQIAGDNVVLGSNTFNRFFLSGKKKDNLWSVDLMQLDDASIAFDLLKEGRLWNINFLGIRVGNSLLIGMEGQYRDDDAHLEAKINLLEANIGDLSHWPSLQKYLSSQQLAGKVRAAGSIHADFDKTLPQQMRFDLKMNGSLKEGMIDDLRLQDIENVSMHYNSENNSLKLALNDGPYQIMGSQHHIKDFVLDWNAMGVRLTSGYHYKNNLFNIDFNCFAPDFNSGEVVITDATPTRQPETTIPLIMHWVTDPNTGYSIEKMTGSLCGIYFDLHRDHTKEISTELINLIGTLNVNMQKAVVLMDKKIAEGVENWEFGDGYVLSGQWNINKLNLENTSFQGNLLGRDFEILGNRFYDLSAQLTYNPTQTSIHNLTISDLCGSLEIEQINCVKSGDSWLMSTPLITVREFQPALLRQIKPSSSRMEKSLNIRQLVIQDLHGTLGNKNSFTGAGQLSFINPPKKNLQHTILAIPAELLTRIGLDLAVLTPVRGTISYKIGDGKATITRFKDIYSKGRASKFYLPHNNYESYVDFDGNLHVQVRMKQYNLIFKLAELFTVTVQGTLANPTYSLQKQQERNEERSLIDIVQSK